MLAHSFPGGPHGDLSDESAGHMPVSSAVTSPVSSPAEPGLFGADMRMPTRYSFPLETFTLKTTIMLILIRFYLKKRGM